MLFFESVQQAWLERFGEPAPNELPDLGKVLNHRSVRRFSEQPISDDVIRGLVGAAQSASTSSNLQLWSVVSVQDPERRNAITQLCGDQKQVRDAPWFFAFFADHYRLAKAARAAGIEPAGLDYAEFGVMALIDVALAAERMVCAAEALGMGVCYIGALRNDPQGIADLLHLPSGTFGAFGLCLGYPSESETAKIKPRLGQDQVWFREQYDQEVSTEEYDSRMRPSFEKRGIQADWSTHSGIRVDGEHMTGREVIMEFLTHQGFFRR